MKHEDDTNSLMLIAIDREKKPLHWADSWRESSWKENKTAATNTQDEIYVSRKKQDVLLNVQCPLP